MYFLENKVKTDSIILTVFNKDWLIDKVLYSIFENTKTNTELIIVIDGCTDNSEIVIKNTLKASPSNISTKIYYADNIYETKANNIGLKASTGDYIIIVQDDMIINEENWNLRMRKPIENYDDIFAVTSKTAHNWKYNFNNNKNASWCDLLMDTEHKNKHNTNRDTFAIRNCVNRGPLLIDHQILKSVNYLDEDYSPQLMDDHDLCYKVFEKHGKKCGLYWIDFISDESWGSTRQGFKKWLYDASHKNYNLLWDRHKDIINNISYNEERTLK